MLEESKYLAVGPTLTLFVLNKILGRDSPEMHKKKTQWFDFIQFVIQYIHLRYYDEL